MIEELVIAGEWKPDLTAEFPTVRVRHVAQLDDPHLLSSQWRDDAFDWWAFDSRVDALDGELRLADDAGDRAFVVEVLNRSQRALRRRNEASSTPLFDRVLERHASLHELSKPLVCADYRHAVDVWQWLLRIEPDASIELQFAALFHDVERLLSECDARVEHLAADYQAFKDAHAAAGAEITRRLLVECGTPAARADTAARLIAAHERKSTDRELSSLNDADALSFFSLNSNGYADYFGPEQTRKKVAYTIGRMSEGALRRLRTIRLRRDVRAMVGEL